MGTNHRVLDSSAVSVSSLTLLGYSPPAAAQERMHRVTFLQLFMFTSFLLPHLSLIVWLGKEFYPENYFLSELWKSSFHCHLTFRAGKETANLIYCQSDLQVTLFSFWKLFGSYLFPKLQCVGRSRSFLFTVLDIQWAFPIWKMCSSARHILVMLFITIISFPSLC